MNSLGKFCLTKNTMLQLKDVDPEIINIAYDRLYPAYSSWGSDRSNDQYNEDFLKIVKSFYEQD